MNEAKKASFSFNDFKIVSFSFQEPPLGDEEFTLEINPSGEFNESTHEFIVTINFRTFDNNTMPFIDVLLKARFTFQGETSYMDIPDYFYLNSIAIVFPFLRSFISTLTLQANIKLIILPVLNLTGLDIPLKENTILIN